MLLYNIYGFCQLVKLRRSGTIFEFSCALAWETCEKNGWVDRYRSELLQPWVFVPNDLRLIILLNVLIIDCYFKKLRLRSYCNVSNSSSQRLYNCVELAQYINHHWMYCSFISMSTAGLNIREDLKWDMYAKLHSGKWQNWRDTLLTIEWFFKMYVLCVSILKLRESPPLTLVSYWNIW
jgi:hypothetical protein